MSNHVEIRRATETLAPVFTEIREKQIKTMIALPVGDPQIAVIHGIIRGLDAFWATVTIKSQAPEPMKSADTWNGLPKDDANG